MADDDGSSEMEGEIINVKPSNRYRGGTTTLYSVLITTAEKGGVFIEEDVLPGRIRYRYSLQALQSRIRDVTLSSNRKRKAVGIRSSGDIQQQQHIMQELNEQIKSLKNSAAVKEIQPQHIMQENARLNEQIQSLKNSATVQEIQQQHIMQENARLNEQVQFLQRFIVPI